MSKELSVEQKKNTHVKNIRENYRQVEKSIVNQLFMKHDLHGTTIGSEREMIWAQLFEMIIPRKFVIEPSVFIIDSEGRVSHEVDLAIMDETYTPYIFRYGKVKFVPIEAVAAVVECKSQSIDPGQIEKWADSLDKMETSELSIARTANSIVNGTTKTQKSTRPIRILCTLKNIYCTDLEGKFDFILLANKEKRDDPAKIEITLNTKKVQGTLLDWYQDLNYHNCEDINLHESAHELFNYSLQDYEVIDDKNENVSLLTFNFQLNQLLMLINNPILFPHRAYAKLFNHFGEEGQ